MSSVVAEWFMMCLQANDRLYSDAAPDAYLFFVVFDESYLDIDHCKEKIRLGFSEQFKLPWPVHRQKTASLRG